MFKRVLFLALASGLLSGLASIIYASAYKTALGADFSTVVSTGGMVLSSLIGTLLAAGGYWLCVKSLKGYGEPVFNFVFSMLTFVSLVPAFGTSLPMDIEMPELFLGLVVPMHFFPAMAWFTLKPLFVKPYATEGVKIFK